MSEISKSDLARLVALFEMTERAARPDADDHVKAEGANAISALLRFLAKYGLTLGDIPELQRRHRDRQAKTGASAAPAQDRSQPDLPDVIMHMLKSYIDVEEHVSIAIVAWTLYAHLFSNFRIAPRLAALSPVPGCGKSKLLMFLEKLVPDPQRHGNITAPSIYRLIENGAPILLLDEGDNLNLKFDRVMRAVFNDGYLVGGTITRTIRNEARPFSIFAPLAIAAIGMLPLPLLERSIIIPMHKSSRTDLKTIEAFGLPEEIARFEALRRLIVIWAQNAQLDLNPSLPKIVRGRIADKWRPLVSAVDSIGNKSWSEAVREAAVTFANSWSDEAAPVALLYDIHAISRMLRTDRAKSAVLVEMLNAMEDGVGIWSAWRGERDDQLPHAITQGEVASLLRRFDRNLRPKPLFELGSRENRGKAGRGYYFADFKVWWKKYCPDLEDDDEAEDAGVVRHLRTESK